MEPMNEERGTQQRLMKRSHRGLPALRQRQAGGVFFLLLMFMLFGALILVTIKVFPIIYDAKALERVFAEMDQEDRFRDGATKKLILDYMDSTFQVNQIRYLDRKQVEVKKDFKRKRYIVTLNYDYPVSLIKSKEDKTQGAMDVAILLSFRNEAILRMK